jgi:hypothetical protein
MDLQGAHSLSSKFFAAVVMVLEINQTKFYQTIHIPHLIVHLRETAALAVV